MDIKLRVRIAFAITLAISVSATVFLGPARASLGDWQPQESGLTNALSATDFIDATRGYAVGNGGAILSTTDSGAMWTRQHACTGGGTCSAGANDRIFDTLTGVSMATASDTYIVGHNGVILKSVSGTWNRQYACQLTAACTTTSPPPPDRLNTQLNALHAITASKAVAVGTSGTIVVTTDGTNWVSRASGVDEQLNSVWLASDMVAYAVGDGGTILKTTDGGTTWVLQIACFNSTGPSCATSTNTNERVNHNLYGVMFSDAQSGYIVGANGTILRTTDGGSTWTFVPSGTTQPLRDVHFSGATGYAVGTDGTILGSTTSGTSWTLMYACATTRPCTQGAADRHRQAILSVDLHSPTVGGAAGEAGLLLRLQPSTSPGPTPTGPLVWRRKTSPVVAALRSSVFVDNSRAFISGSQGTLLTTEDGGGSWTQMAVCANGAPCEASSPNRVFSYLQGIDFQSPTHGYTVGDGGTILETNSGGLTWTQQVACQITPDQCSASSNDDLTINLESVSYPAVDKAIAVGANGSIVRTTNSEDWTQVPSGTTQNLRAVAFVGQIGIAVGDGGTILKSTDQGASWIRRQACTTNATPCTQTVNQALHSVSFANTSTVYAVGANGTILVSQNAGDTWSVIPPVAGVTQTLHDIAVSGSNGYAVGVGGTILHTANSGTSWSPEFACVTSVPCNTNSQDRIFATLNSVSMSDSSRPVIAGSDGVILALEQPSSPSPTATDASSPTPSVEPSLTPSPDPTVGPGPPPKRGSFLTIRYGRRTFKGKIASEDTSCAEDRRVKVKRARKGPDRTVGTAESNDSERWSIRLRRRARPGRYYAIASRTTTSSAICTRARSARVRV